LHMTGHRTK